MNRFRETDWWYWLVTDGLLIGSLGTIPPLDFIHWIQLAGTAAVVTVGYCPLARILVLMPWNRRRPLTAAQVRNTIVAPPVAGSIMEEHTGSRCRQYGGSHGIMRWIPVTHPCRRRSPRSSR